MLGSGMKIVPLFLAALCLFSLPAGAAETECILGREAITPVMKIPPELAASYSTAMDEESRHLTESVTLPDGMKISYSVGGCVHYGFSYVFENIPAELLEKYQSYELAVALLRRVPGFEKGEENFYTAIFEEEGKKQSSRDEGGGFACGDAWCVLRQEGNRAELAYDFPL